MLNTPLRIANEIATQYGGAPSDWVKKTSPSYQAADGIRIEIHLYENIRS